LFISLTIAQIGILIGVYNGDNWKIVGEWWKSDTEAVINEALKSGLAPNVSDAHTINGLPGTVANCSTQGIFFISIIHTLHKYHEGLHFSWIPIQNWKRYGLSKRLFAFSLGVYLKWRLIKQKHICTFFDVNLPWF